jgi:hypothetical protein
VQLQDELPLPVVPRVCYGLRNAKCQEWRKPERQVRIVPLNEPETGVAWLKTERKCSGLVLKSSRPHREEPRPVQLRVGRISVSISDKLASGPASSS